MAEKHDHERHSAESVQENAANLEVSNSKTDKTTIRYVVGSSLSRISDWIDEHYQLLNGVNKAVIVISAAILLYHSPLSRKYRVSEHILPADFRRRAKLRGVVTSIPQDNSNSRKGSSIYINVIHKPLMERLFPFLYRNKECNNELKIRLFGVKNEPDYSVPWLHSRGLVKDGSKAITFQLLYMDSIEKENAAVCHVWHRAPESMFFKDNLSKEILRSGCARFNDEQPGTHACNNVKCIRDINRHLDSLYQAQETAFRKKLGIWKNRELEPRDLPSAVVMAGYSIVGNIFRKLFKRSKVAKK